MSSFDKVVKLACKPKAAAPKDKYLDPIIAATWSDDGAVHDVCKALVSRIREPNAIVVFKALIVLHTMIRNGSTDNVLAYLSSSNILRLQNVSSANWEGYAAPQNLQSYALYLESRIVAYKDIKHDAIKVQSESNRDMRNSLSMEAQEESRRGRKNRKTEPSALSRSKTVMGRKLRSMTVEKGLLRETKVVHRMIDALVECRFYLEDLENELTITALQMLVKDLLILFQAGNEGVINVLEHYFEMSHIDAKGALKLYRHFCKQAESVVEFLGVARKLQNLLNVPIPNLKHAPVSLAGALQEYLDDPNFEQNRLEYRLNKSAAEGGTTSTGAKKSTSTSNGEGTKVTTPLDSYPGLPEIGLDPPSKNSKEAKSTEMQDFFAAIEAEQPTMFNPQTNSPNVAYFQQQAAANPFLHMLAGQSSTQQQQALLIAQQSAFLVPQATAVPAQPNPFSNFLMPQGSQPTGHLSFLTFLPQQTTGMPQVLQHPYPAGAMPQPFLQPQMTGVNPFRQSMLIPQTTGMQLFGVEASAPSLPQSQSMMNFGQASNGSSLFPQSATPLPAPKPSFGPISSFNNTPPRPASTPLTSSTGATSISPQPVKAHQTGTKNPFGPIAPPPVPKPPTLFELSTGLYNQNKTEQQQPQQDNSPQVQSQPTGVNGFNFGNSSLNPGAVDISSVASSFAFMNSKPTSPATTSTPLTSLNANGTRTLVASTTSAEYTSPPLSFQNTTIGSNPAFPSVQPTNTPSMANANLSVPPVKSHATGMTGLKPFKPTSSFGASLFESLPPIAGSGPTTPAVTGTPLFSNTSIPAASTPSSITASTSTVSSLANTPPTNMSFLSIQPTGTMGGFGTSSFGSTLGVGLRPQMTGGGTANPFRASMAGNLHFGGSNVPPMPPLPVGFGGMQPFDGLGSTRLGTSQLGTQNHQQPNGTTPLI